jgi:hypothetical protein
VRRYRLLPDVQPAPRGARRPQRDPAGDDHAHRPADPACGPPPRPTTSTPSSSPSASTP